MVDGNDVIDWFVHCATNDNADCHECPYWDVKKCDDKILDDLIKLLKEQEPKTIKDHYIPSDDMGIENGECPSCGKLLPRAVYPVACGYCGQLLKWSES